MNRASKLLSTRLAIVLVVALLGAACGSSDGLTVGEAAVDDSAAAPSHSAEAPPAGSPAFGATLDEVLGPQDERPSSSPPPDGFEEIEWEDLIPAGFSAADISARFNERIAEVEPGSPEADAVFAELQAEYAVQPINPDLAGNAIQLAGFIAPLTYVGDLITEFLLVPYFGACIHVPPPPANQTVMVTLEDGQGLTIDESWGAVWVTGTLAIDGAETDLATAGFSINGAQTGVYTDF